MRGELTVARWMRGWFPFAFILPGRKVSSSQFSPCPLNAFLTPHYSVFTSPLPHFCLHLFLPCLPCSLLKTYSPISLILPASCSPALLIEWSCPLYYFLCPPNAVSHSLERESRRSTPIISRSASLSKTYIPADSPPVH